MNSLARTIQTKTTLSSLAIIATRKKKRHTITIPMHTQTTLIKVKSIFLGEENHNPLFIYSQKAPGSPKLNQLAKSAVFCDHNQISPSQSIARYSIDSWVGRTMRLRRLLNTGIAEAIIQAITQRATAIPIQDPTAMKSRLCIRSVPAKIRV